MLLPTAIKRIASPMLLYPTIVREGEGLTGSPSRAAAVS